MHNCLDKKCSWKDMDFIGLKGAAQGTRQKQKRIYPHLLPYALNLLYQHRNRVIERK